MTDDSETGAVPVEDAAVADPPTVDEVLQQQRREHPEQAATSTTNSARADHQAGTQDAGGDVVGREPSGDLEIEGPNSA